VKSIAAENEKKKRTSETSRRRFNKLEKIRRAKQERTFLWKQITWAVSNQREREGIRRFPNGKERQKRGNTNDTRENNSKKSIYTFSLFQLCG
jgi:hypothetical protein